MTINVDQLPIDYGDEIEQLMRRFYPLLINKAFGDASGVVGVDIAFDLEMEEVQEVLDELAKEVRNVAQTTRDEIRALVGVAAEQGLDMRQLADEIRSHGEIVSKHRAQMIARTETAAAYSKGSILAYERSGVVSGIEWLTFDPCPVCEALAGRVASLGDPFADGIAHPPAHPNCRCAIAPVVE